MQDKISVLVSARKNSKYLAKFLHGLMARTAEFSNIEVLVMLNEHDTWNLDLVENYQGFFHFYSEDYQLGRAGLHVYFNDLYKHCTGDWVIYFCEDHYINAQDWDLRLRAIIEGTGLAEHVDGQPDTLQHQNGRLDPSKVWCIIPKFDNAGSMNHMLSRGFIEAIDGRLSEHGNLDSYINDVIKWIPRERRISMDEPLFHDFTHDQPSPMSDAHLQAASTPEAIMMPLYDSPAIAKCLKRDIAAVRKYIESEE